MKTIKFISESISLMRSLQLPVKMEIGTFKVNSKGSLINWAGWEGKYDGSLIKFTINFRPDHIQTLLNLGIKIDFNTVVMAYLSPNSKRFKSGRDAIKQGRYAPYYYAGDPNNKQTGVTENWLNADATCDINTLVNIDKYCRDNHRNSVSISNDTQLRLAGWEFKNKYPSFVTIESQYKNIKSIRKNAIGKPESKLLPIHKRVLKINNSNI